MTPPAEEGEAADRSIDRKLARKLKEKKIAQGHAEDDHVQQMG